MDDLSGLDWSSSSSNKPKPATNASFAYPSLRPTPSPLGSGRNTPLSAQGSGLPTSLSGNAASKPASATAKAAQDSFSGLINFGNNKNTANLSLLERQELLNAEKRRKEEEKRRQQQANYGNGQFFDMLGSGGSTGASASTSSRTGSPAVPLPSTSPSTGKRDNSDTDLFAAFKADTKVDQASYYPPNASSGSGSRQPTPANASTTLDLSDPSAWGSAKPAETSGGGSSSNNDDDDPFGLNEFQGKANAAPAPPPTAGTGDEDAIDFLGDLGRPVEEVRREAEEKKRKEREKLQQQQRERERKREERRRRQQHQQEPGKPIEDSDSASSGTSPTRTDNGEGGIAKTGNAAFNKAVAELVDYGFSAEDARRGLTESRRGTDVQAAVNWLLDDAHRQAKEKARAKQGGRDVLEEDSRSTSRGRYAGGAPSRIDSRSSAVLGDGEFAKTAAVVGSSLLKTANSLWKTGQKRVQKAVQEFQQETSADPNQPRWMRSAGEHDDAGFADGDARRHAEAVASATAAATDEAMMLESGPRPERRPAGTGGRTAPSELHQNTNPFRTQSQSSAAVSASRTSSPAPRWQQQQQQTQQRSGGDPRLRLTKQALEEESAQAYVSPARRRRTPVPASAAPASSTAAGTRTTNETPEGDLLSNSTALPQRPAPQQRTRLAAASSGGAQSSSQQRQPTPQPKAAVPRRVPPVNSLVLQASSQHRAAGAAHFKRGDYAAAHASYSASLTDIPAGHPLLAVLFCNRALTALKTGEPRQAVADADEALTIIGPGRGEGEVVALEDGTAATRDLKDLYGKALTRKAEALEQMEKWGDAGQVWQQCVEAGVGGATAIAGRQRCQRALAPKPNAAAVAAARPKPAAKPAVSASSLLSSPVTVVPAAANGQDFAAVSRLRAANLASEREDAEKLALTDKVDARIAAWRDGKKDNLRALLGSMDTVLWEGSGWKKVGLHELVMPNKVKIAYMRAISKTHPDKLPQDASTEIRMVAGTVFATLNESWDKFKADNKL